MWIVLPRVLTVEGYKFTSHLASLPAKANDKAIDDHQEMERIAPTLNPAFVELFNTRGFGFLLLTEFIWRMWMGRTARTQMTGQR